MAKHRNDDKRSFHRVIYHADAFIHAGEDASSCKILDISLKGCLLELPDEWLDKAKAVNRVDVLLEGGLAVHMEVSLSHLVNNQAGYCCNHIDLDSVTVLRRLIELNLGDSELLNRDIKALIHAAR